MFRHLSISAVLMLTLSLGFAFAQTATGPRAPAVQKPTEKTLEESFPFALAPNGTLLFRKVENGFEVYRYKHYVEVTEMEFGTDEVGMITSLPHPAISFGSGGGVKKMMLRLDICKRTFQSLDDVKVVLSAGTLEWTTDVIRYASEFTPATSGVVQESKK